MQAMDAFNFERLACARPHAAGSLYGGGGARHEGGPTRYRSYRDALLGIPLLPRESSPIAACTSPTAYGGSLTEFVDLPKLPDTCDLYAAALEPYVQHAVDVPPHEAPLPPGRAAPAIKNDSAKKMTRPQLCAPYDAGIDASLRAMEKDAKERPSPRYLEKMQGDRLSRTERTRLICWMHEFSLTYDLAPDIFHRAVSYVDRVLSVRTLNGYSEDDLHILGAVAVFVAAKYEDQSTLKRLNAMGVASYLGFPTSMEVLDVESNMIAALDYRLGGPTAYTFVAHFTRYSESHGDEQDMKVQKLAHRLAEQSLLHYGLLGYLPSVVAASAIFLARLHILSCTDDHALVRPWSKELQELTGYSAMDLVVCTRDTFQPVSHCAPTQLLDVHFEDA